MITKLKTVKAGKSQTKYCLTCGKKLPDHRVRNSIRYCNLFCQKNYDGIEASPIYPTQSERLNQLVTNPGSRQHSQWQPGYVYVFHDPVRNIHKIGLSVDPENRLKSIRSQCPHVQLLCCRKVSNMRRAEMFLHGRYAHVHVNCEWFRLSTSDINDIRDIDIPD